MGLCEYDVIIISGALQLPQSNRCVYNIIILTWIIWFPYKVALFARSPFLGPAQYGYWARWPRFSGSRSPGKWTLGLFIFFLNIIMRARRYIFTLDERYLSPGASSVLSFYFRRSEGNPNKQGSGAAWIIFIFFYNIFENCQSRLWISITTRRLLEKKLSNLWNSKQSVLLNLIAFLSNQIVIRDSLLYARHKLEQTESNSWIDIIEVENKSLCSVQWFGKSF